MKHLDVKKLVPLFITCLLSITDLSAQNKCSISCSFTSTWICPESKFWQRNSKALQDESFMNEIGYYKEGNCYQLRNASPFVKTGTKSDVNAYYKKLKNLTNSQLIKREGC